jgi:signal peptidase I
LTIAENTRKKRRDHKGFFLICKTFWVDFLTPPAYDKVTIVLNALPPMEQINKKPPTNEWKQFLWFCLIALAVRSVLLSPCRVPSGSMLPTLQVGDFPLLSKITYGWTRFSLFGGGYIPYFKGKIMDRGMPKRGDVVVFTNHNDVTQDFIKRAVGIPGDSIQMKGGILFLNDQPITLELKAQNVRAYTASKQSDDVIHADQYTATLPTEGGVIQYDIFKHYPFGKGPADDTDKIFIPEDHFFAMGDNWDHSGDSRFMNDLGLVHKDYLLGRPLFTYLSIDHEHISWWKPWTWLLLPFKIRFRRCFYQPIQPKLIKQSQSQENQAPLENPAAQGQESVQGNGQGQESGQPVLQPAANDRATPSSNQGSVKQTQGG